MPFSDPQEVNTDCPFCNKANELVRHEHKEGEPVATPSPGAIALCYTCGEWAIFEGEGKVIKLRKPTDEEYVEIAADDACTRIRKGWVKMRAEESRQKAAADAKAKAAAAVKPVMVKPTAHEITDYGQDGSNMVDALFNEISASIRKHVGAPSPQVLDQVKLIFALGAWSAVNIATPKASNNDPAAAGRKLARYQKDLQHYFSRHPSVIREFKLGEDK